jgi:phage terminase large subunit
MIWMMTMNVKLSNIIAPSFKEVHKALKDEKYTHFFLYGGRGSTKSSFIAIEIILGIMRDPNANAVVLRKVKDTLKDSVFEQLRWAIERLGVQQYWHIPEAMLVLSYIPTGQRIIFRGADKPKKIKSIKFSKGYCKYVWFEECDEFSGMEEIRMINQSLMRGGTKFIIFYSFNPPKIPNSWVNKEVQLVRKDRLCHHSTYLTVPKEWLGEQFFIEAKHLEETSPISYRHEYLGEAVGTGGLIYDNWTEENFNVQPLLANKNYELCIGIDFGWVDPFAMICSLVNTDERMIYIFDEHYERGKTNDEIAKIITHKGYHRSKIYCDAAEPKSIEELRRAGISRVEAAQKGPDSILNGIRYLHQFQIVVHSKCEHTKTEFSNYAWQKDKYGELTGRPGENFNHLLDSLRYSLTGIKNPKTVSVLDINQFNL